MKASELSPFSIGIMGGSGALQLLDARDGFVVTTPWGDPSSEITQVTVGACVVPQAAWMIQRHGNPHRIPPHRVNYRANLWALKEAGVRHVIAINAVGGIRPNFLPADLVLVDQLIDYTWGRAHTYSDGPDQPLVHCEFGEPYHGPMRSALIEAGERCGVGMHLEGCYGATQGPRLETEAEIRRMARDGCDVVGMTGMPEAGLARELGLDYACLCVVANPAAGIGGEPISLEELYEVLATAMGKVGQLLSHLPDPEQFA